MDRPFFAFGRRSRIHGHLVAAGFPPNWAQSRAGGEASVGYINSRNDRLRSATRLADRLKHGEQPVVGHDRYRWRRNNFRDWFGGTDRMAISSTPTSNHQ